MGPKIWMRRVFLAIFYCSFTYNCGNTFTFGSALQLKQEELTFMFSWFSLWSNNGWSIKTIILPNLWTMDFNGWSKRAIEVQLWKPPHLFFLHGFLSGFKTNSDFNKKKKMISIRIWDKFRLYVKTKTRLNILSRCSD